MIIPIKCFTCGMVIADKYRYFATQVRLRKSHNSSGGAKVDKVTYLTSENMDKTPEGEVLDELGLNKMCCRRHLLTHVDIE
jgi:DNA-directed RNA polymerase subunit N